MVCKLLVKILVLGIATESKLRNPLQWPKKVQKVLAAPVRQIPSCEKAVKSILSKDKELRNTSLTIDIDVTKNEVTLSGTVDSEAVRRKAVELAKTAQVGRRNHCETGTKQKQWWKLKRPRQWFFGTIFMAKS